MPTATPSEASVLESGIVCYTLPIVSMDRSYDLQSVERPGRYIGGEWNSVVKDGPVRCRLLLAFPDAYEIGMSHLGLRILYSLVNGCDTLAAERVFSPWTDMETRMRTKGEFLQSLESGRPAAEFDIIGFSLQHELNYTNLLTMLDLAGLPIRSADRGDGMPLVIAGGPAVFNPEPVAPFIDLFLIGDAEERLPELMLLYAELKGSGVGKADILAEMSKSDGVYVPSLYETEIDSVNGFEVVKPPEGSRPFIRKAVVEDLDRYPFPADVVVPFCDIVHDRAAIELARGCSRGCRFCQAGVIYMPERQRDPQQAADTVLKMLAATGYGDVGLSSLTPNDYRGLRELVEALMSRLRPEGISLSLASLSPSGLDRELLELISGVRKTGLTIAPEAGTQRLRDVINKGISEEEILTASRLAFELGWKLLKLYFMIGLPTEIADDVEEIGKLALRIAHLGKGVKTNVAVSNFVPKPHTPFQWVKMASKEELQQKQADILQVVKRVRRINVKYHDIDTSLLEGILSRGDRKVADAVEAAWRLGCRFDGWGDQLRIDLWRRAFEQMGVDPAFYLHRELSLDAALPWSHIDTGVKTGFLRAEYDRAMRSEPTHRCSPRNCPECGACPPSLLKRRRLGELKLAVKLSPAKAESAGGEPQRWRLRYSKGGTIRLLSHLDMLRLVARVFRRASVEVALSEGFHPQSRIAFGPALPLGVEGRNEYLDAKILSAHTPGELTGRLNESSPQGLYFDAAEIIDSNEPSLSAAIIAARYRIRRLGGGAFERAAIDRFMERERADWTRKRSGGGERTFNLRPYVLSMDTAGDGDELLMILSLDTRLQGPQARPSEVAAEAFSLDFNEIEVIREQLFIERKGEMIPPIGRDNS